MTDQTQAVTSLLRQTPPGGTLDLTGQVFDVAGTIVVDGSVTLVGGTFRALPSQGRDRHTFRIVSDHVTFTGVTVDGGNPLGGESTAAQLRSGITQARLDSQHGIAVLGAYSVLFENCHVHHTVGDGWYIGRAPDTAGNVRPPARVVQLTGCYGHHNGRHNICTTAAEIVSVDRSLFDAASRSTWDMEPQGAPVIGVSWGDCWVGTSRLNMLAAEGRGDVSGVILNGVHVLGDTLSIVVEDRTTGGQGRRSDWTIINCTSDTLCGNPQLAAIRATRIDGLTVTSNTQPMSKRDGTEQMRMVRATDCTDVVVRFNDVGPSGVGQVIS